MTPVASEVEIGTRFDAVTGRESVVYEITRAGFTRIDAARSPM